MVGFDGRADADGRPVLRRGLRVDRLGEERLVLDPASGVVHSVRGAAVKALDAIVAGRAAADDEGVAGLVSAGIVEVPGVRRREALLLTGSVAALASLGIATLALPTASAAASPGGGGGGLPEQPESAITTNYNTTTGVLRVFWESQPEAFEYTYSIAVTLGSPGAGALSGTLDSGSTFNTIYTVASGSTIEVTFTSLTTPESISIQTFQLA